MRTIVGAIVIDDALVEFDPVRIAPFGSSLTSFYFCLFVYSTIVEQVGGMSSRVKAS